MVEIRQIHQELDMVARRLEDTGESLGCSRLLLWIMLKARADSEIEKETLTTIQSSNE
jgi:hypothetical protein